MLKGTSEILKIEDPAKRVAAAVIFQAFLDLYYSSTPELVESAQAFLENGAGEWADYFDHDFIPQMYERFKEDE